MPDSTISAKGRTTVPAAVRALVQAKPGTRLVWSVTPDGTIIVRPMNKSILNMAGISWDTFLVGGAPVTDDFLPERDSQQQPEREAP